jgi:hypothetical protein
MVNILIQTFTYLNKNKHSKLIVEAKKKFHENSSKKVQT